MTFPKCDLFKNRDIKKLSRNRTRSRNRAGSKTVFKKITILFVKFQELNAALKIVLLLPYLKDLDESKKRQRNEEGQIKKIEYIAETKVITQGTSIAVAYTPQTF